MSIFSKILTSFFTAIVFFIIPCTTFAQMQFTENKGQWHTNVQYRGDFSSGSFFLENKGFSVLLHNTDDLVKMGEYVHGHSDASTSHDDKDSKGTFKQEKNYPKEGTIHSAFTLHSFAYKVDFLGASNSIRQQPDKVMETYNNYFIGNDKNKWAGNCKIYQAVTYANVYPNIDVRYYSDAAGRLKYDFIVKPGGNVGAIAMRYDGVSSIVIKDRQLIIKTPVSVVKELYPYSYQTSSKGGRMEVDCKYVVRDNVVSFNVKDYDTRQTLIIDPSIIFASFTGSTADNWGYTATPGPDGSFFAGGIVFASGYPVSSGAYDITYGGGGGGSGAYPPGHDIGIFKFSANGSKKLYATYLGGSGNEQPHSMITDAQGNLIVAGRTNSVDYPSKNSFGPLGSDDIILTKFNATGTALIGSVKIGGSGEDGVNIKPKYTGNGAESLRRNYGDDARSEVILDAANNIILVSCTRPVDGKTGNANFPVKNSPIQPVYGGGNQDGVIIKFTPDLSALLFSTYFGGDADDACFVASINPVTGNLYVGGATASTNLPGNKTGTINSTFEGGDADGFVTELRPDGSAILKTTYLSANRIGSTPSIDMVYGLKFDRLGFPYVMGTTTGSWPVINAKQVNAGSKQFISKLQPDLSAYIYSTVFGAASPEPKISPIAFLVDRCENVYVSGWGGGINVGENYSKANTFGMPEVNPLPGIPAADGADFYFYVLEKNANSQFFGSHYGQNGGLGDHVDGGTSRFDANGVIYQAICANCGGWNQNPSTRNIRYPTTAGVVAPFNGSVSCNELALKIEMNFAGVGSKVQASINAVVNDTTGCIPLKVIFTDVLRKGKKYYWDFGDGRKDITTSNVDSNTYNTTGIYRVMLITEDSLTCNIRDTSYVTIKAGDNIANLSFTSLKGLPCTSLSYIFTNTSTASRGAYGPKSFIWDFGDGSKPDTTGLTPPILHTFPDTGAYTVRLLLIDTSFCNSPDSLVKIIRVNPIVKARFITPAIGCAPYQAVFQNISTAGTDFNWEFGDGSFSTDENPTHLYLNPGQYKVRLIATDTSTCNKIDSSAYFTITVFAKPTALFSWGPNPPQANVPVRFTNLSSGATRYVWNFGDAETSTEVNPTHEYNETGNYLAELIAYNAAGCTDTFSLSVDVLINPLLDVPNAFTPAQGGINSIIFVRGFGIKRMNWRIYNRWGQVVFESENKRSGWDGTFKGKLQPVDVYTYTLDAEFSDGKKLRKTGDITLLR